MISKAKQMNKMGVKSQTNKKVIKPKNVGPVVKKKLKVWECLNCGRKQIKTEKPIDCSCHNTLWAINKNYEVE